MNADGTADCDIRSAADPGNSLVPCPAVIEALSLHVDRDDPPALAKIETWCRQGLNTVALVDGTLGPELGRGTPGRFLEWLRVLRDLTSCAVNVDWEATANIAALAPMLHHIAPPRLNEDPALRRWREAHRYGICYSRFGPGFVTVIDRRDGGSEFVLDTADHIEVFNRAQTGVMVDCLSISQRGALLEMENENLLLTLEGVSLALPFRMKHWPVPFTAI